jgi:hypothetical protein
VTFAPGSHLLEIGESAFASCTSLTSICIPASVRHIGDKCFAGCRSMRNFQFEDGCRTNLCFQSIYASPRSLRCFLWLWGGGCEKTVVWIGSPLVVIVIVIVTVLLIH